MYVTKGSKVICISRLKKQKDAAKKVGIEDVESKYPKLWQILTIEKIENHSIPELNEMGAGLLTFKEFPSIAFASYYFIPIHKELEKLIKDLQYQLREQKELTELYKGKFEELATRKPDSQ